MEKYDYSTSSLEEFFEAHEDKNLLVLPAKALKELAKAKQMRADADAVTRTLKKYLINARRAQTNAKIVESLIL